MSNNIIEIILKEKKITDLLENRGIFPVRESGGKLVYICPIHEGDTSPSFMVFTDNVEEYQTYHCFSCHCGYDIINLVCDLDNVSIKQAVKYLIKGLDIDPADMTDSVINKLIENIGQRKREDKKSTEKILLEIGCFCRNHLKKYRDEEEINFFFKIFEKIDYFARIKDTDTLKEMYDMLLQEGISQRIDLFKKREEEKILETIRRKD